MVLHNSDFGHTINYLLRFLIFPTPMNKNFSLLFKLRKDKINADTVPIYLKITIDGKKVELFTKRYINPKKWDQKLQKAKGSNDEANSINEYKEILLK
jgi:hypothetical protein